MKRGIILEVNNQFVTLLTPEGEFLRSRKVKEHYEIGEEIDFFPVTESVSKKKFFFRMTKLRASIASSVAAALLFFSVFTLYDSNEVYAYMTIDINPSIEAGVDKKLRVVSLEAFNPEGEEVVNRLEEWMNEPIDSVTQAIINESKDSGYYKEGGEVLLTTVIVEEEDAPLAEELNQNVQMIVEESKGENILITVIQSTEEDRDYAIKKGISTGKYIKETLKVEKAVEKQEKKENKALIKEEEHTNHKNQDNGKVTNNDDKGKKLKEEKPKVPVKGNENNKNKNKDEGIENTNINSESNKSKDNQEDKKGPPEAVEKAKEQRDHKKQEHQKNKNKE